MEHTGEGHYGVYLEQEHTGLNALRRRFKANMADAMIQCSISWSDGIVRAFKRYERDTSSPSDATSLIFGAYHSPISKTIVRSNIHKTSSSEFSLTVAKPNEWVTYTVPDDVVSYPMIVQGALYGELLDALLALGDPPCGGLLEPVAVHLEADLFTYRAMITLAETYELHLRIFPTPSHPHFDKHRVACEQGPKSSNGKYGKPQHNLKGNLEGLLEGTPSRTMRYHVLAYCPACAKHLLPEKRLQCSQCKIAFYCNAECQKKDWKILHKHECKKFSKLIAEADCEYCTKA